MHSLSSGVILVQFREQRTNECHGQAAPKWQILNFLQSNVEYSKAKAKSGFSEFVTFTFLEFDITCDQGKNKNM